jgi:hypothetical protein
MRISVACLLIVATGLPMAQDSQKLRVRYGEPDIERFTVAGDIGLTVEYGSDGLACQIVIERKQPLLHSEQVGNYMAPEAVSEIIDELIPPASRGRSLYSMIESMGCAEGRIEEYENVWIARHSDMCVPLKREREGNATVVFKRQLCPASPYAQMHNGEFSRRRPGKYSDP